MAQMTWTVIYLDSDGKLQQKVLNAPHGGETALKAISEQMEKEVIGIVAGNHCLFFSEKFSKIKLYNDS